ncbi:MAG: hypothetical protein U0894_13075 [Pirellulales bacterium]
MSFKNDTGKGEEAKFHARGWDLTSHLLLRGGCYWWPVAACLRL